MSDGPIPECGSIRNLLVPYLDGEAADSERRRVEAHLAACDACARELEQHRAIGEALRAGCRVPAGGGDLDRRGSRPGLAGRARMAAIAHRRARTFRLSALAALLLVMAGILAWGVLAGRGLLLRSPADPGDDLLGNLDVLEAFEAEGVEPSPEMVQVLLDWIEDAPAGKEAEALDTAIFETLLEEEIGGESL